MQEIKITDKVIPEVNLFRGIVYCVISDYFKSGGYHKEISERMIFDESGSFVKHFNFLCDMAGFDRSWVKSRVKHAKKAEINWRTMQSIGERVLGMVELSQYIYDEYTRRGRR